MGFFKDFKNDMKQAVNELIPGNEEMVSEYDDEDMVNTLEEVPEEEAFVNTLDESVEKTEASEIIDEDIEDVDLSDIEDFEMDEEDYSDSSSNEGFVDTLTDINQTDAVQADMNQTDSVSEKSDMDSLADLLSGAVTIEELAKMEPNVESNIEPNEEPNIEPEMTSETTAEYIVEGEGPEVEVPEVEESIHQQEEPVEEDAMKAQEVAPMSEDKIIEITSMKDTEVDTQNVKEEASVSVEEVSDSTTYISKGTRIEGNLFTDGSVDVIGTVEGDVSCYGKLVVSGLINGKVNASEIYANAAKINGEIVSAGSVKIGVGSVVVGNVEAQSAVVAGAVNGDLDVKGPVIVDSTAVIMGNIKSRSVQINNGAVIEGFCSQCYSDIDVKSFFA